MPKAKPIPDGFHTLTPHIVVRNASKAIDFYKQAFGAEELVRHSGPGGSIMHATIKIGDSMLMLTDENIEWGCKSPLAVGGTSITLHVYVPDADAAFDRAVKAGAKVKMPLADQFWGARYGQLTDPYGHEWSIATHKEDVSEAEVARRAAAMFSAPAEGAGKPGMKPAAKPKKI